MARKRKVGNTATPRDRVRANNGARPAKAKKPRKPKGGDGGGHWFWRWTKRLFVWGFAVFLLAAIALGTAVYFARQNLPSFEQLKSSQNGQMIVVRARDGSQIVSLGPSYGKWLESEDIPQVMKDAMISVEDRRYYSHFGVDPLGLARAIYNAFNEDRRVSATSTITQQLARNIFLNNNRTVDRKAREAILAFALESKFTKEEILELYLNKVYFGGGAYGIDSASRKFFSHPATELSTAEAAIIAGLVKAPSRYSPTADIDAAVNRANVVVAQMRKYGKLSPGEAARVDPDAVKLAEEKGQNSVRYFTDWALPQLDFYLPNTLEPIEVWTTLDVGMQRTASAAIKSHSPDGTQGALVSIDNDGAILALVGGTDYVTSNYNRATDAMRQPGSSWKLFVYLAALEAGYTPDDMVKDVPVTIDGWSPRNSGGNFSGEMDVRTAFSYSKNTVAAQLGNEVGFSTVAAMARRFGISTPIATYPSMVLGSNEVRLIDMTRAFASVSAGGRSVEPYGILKVTTVEGETLYEREKPRSFQLVPSYVAAGMTDLLQSAVTVGTGRAAQIGRPVAGKTGTTSSNKDGYFVGFSSGITTGVWMGRDDNKRVGGLQGGRAPAQAFAAFMRYAVKDRPVTKFDTDLELPEWQLEPDDEFLYGDPDDYYFVDEDGNLIEPRQRGGESEGEDEDERDVLEPVSPRDGPPAASDDFLERATGRSASPSPSPTPREPQQPAAPANDVLTPQASQQRQQRVRG